MKDFFEFKWKYCLHAVVSIFKKPARTDKFLFVSQTGSEDWILGAKAKRLSKYFGSESEVVFSRKFKGLPIANGYFFLHQKYFAKALRYNPHLKKVKCMTMFTHPEWNKFYSKSHAKYTLINAHKVVCLNKNMADELIEIGIPESKIEVCHIGSCPDFFVSKNAKRGNTVGFCCGYYERKNPELIIKLVRQTPDINFILVGRDWNKYEKFDELIQMPNFTYYENVAYEDYPSLYHKMDVFVSPSFLEGGPVPLLEAMLCNVVPVASNTGFCPDIIKHGKNGFLFDPYNDSISHVQGLIKKALCLKADTRAYVVKHSWENYGNKLINLYQSA